MEIDANGNILVASQGKITSLEPRNSDLLVIEKGYQACFLDLVYGHDGKLLALQWDGVKKQTTFFVLPISKQKKDTVSPPVVNSKTSSTQSQKVSLEEFLLQLKLESLLPVLRTINSHC